MEERVILHTILRLRYSDDNNNWYGKAIFASEDRSLLERKILDLQAYDQRIADLRKKCEDYRSEYSDSHPQAESESLEKKIKWTNIAQKDITDAMRQERADIEARNQAKEQRRRASYEAWLAEWDQARNSFLLGLGVTPEELPLFDHYYADSEPCKYEIGKIQFLQPQLLGSTTESSEKPCDEAYSPSKMNSPAVQEAFQRACDKLLALDREEFHQLLDQHEKEHPRCNPDDCGGSCQGMGWCYACEDFRGDAPDEHMEELMG